MVVLRRLANPYLPPNDPETANNLGNVAFDPAKPANPYITVDLLNYVPSMDAIYEASDSTAARPANTGMAMGTPPDMGYDPMTPTPATNPYQRYSVGKVQPLAGFFSGTTAPTIAAPATYPASFLLIQKPANPSGGQVNHTLGRHNGTTDAAPPPSGLPGTASETIVMPFDWLVHYDRPLSNPLELLQVSCRKPHELTQLFVPNGQTNAWTPNHTANWLLPIAAGKPTTGLYRAFELLRVKPWDYGTPMGGKVYGRINLNAVQDNRIFSALLDPQAGNTFTSADVTSIGTTILGNRTHLPSTPATLPDGTTVIAWFRAERERS